ncbi:MAG: VOC family protein [Planctomycetes bacterium]|nr:VOC family protein [Planctomycetota bacterium]
MPSVRSVHETILYGDDVPAVAAFYRDVIGLREIGTPAPGSAAFRLPEGDAVLLIFSRELASTPGRGVPIHGAHGPGHIAFRAHPEPGALDAWTSRFTQHAVKIELDRTWALGGRSTYVRDPAGNSVEIVEGTIWAP